MSKTIDINVHHVTRVEGHGNLRIKAKDGTVELAQWQVPEAPRFFEAMVRGRSYEDIQTIVARICGICSVTHSFASVKATEAAFGITLSEQVEKLRVLTHYSEQLESHALHVGYLVAPDLLGVKSVVPLVASHPEAVKTVIRLHRTGNKWMELLAGRMTHPVTLKPGGFARFPTEAELRGLKAQLESIVPDLHALAALIQALAGRLPKFERPTEYVALVSDPGTYTFYHGDIGTTDAPPPLSVQKFEEAANEYVSPQSTAKWCKWHRESYMCGALGRFNLNAQHLLPLAKRTAKDLGLKQGCTNPYMNSVAQVVECVQIVEHGLQLIDEVLTAGLKPEKARAVPRAGTGAGAVEAPRGILFHRYTYDARGNCVSANCCIPTNQNHANIQKDLEALVPQILDRTQDEIRLLCEMLVRAYDPCISCSTHFLNIEFV